MNYEDIQKEEAKTWLIEDETKRLEKAQRETARYPMMAKQMGLNFIDTSRMLVYDIGAGPLLGVSSVIPTKQVLRVDPLADEYSKYFDVSTYLKAEAEDVDFLAEPDLVIVTNALDHFRDPKSFLQNLKERLKPGAYFAHFHAIDNAITHPHPAHQHNINPEILHSILDSDFETVWELKYPELRYGWVPYMGRVGQPAFATLFRKTTGYGTA